jgi:ATP-dependent Clp protease ATP-binding subunit ClpA
MAKKPASIADAQHPVHAHFKVSDAELDNLISRYCTDISAINKAGKRDPVCGRDNEVDEIITILLHRGRGNVVLLGGAGTGKTAVFHAIAQRILKGDMPKLLENARVLELDFSLLGAGSDSRGEFEGRLVPLLHGIAERNETREYPTTILCIDEMHTIMRTCSASSSSGVADLLKPYLTLGSLRVIGATTDVEYDEHVKRDPAMDRRFQKIALKQPSIEETIEILKGIRIGYENYFGITISDEACQQIVKLSQKYIRNRNNPDKSIMTLDSACARFVKEGAPGGKLKLENIKQAIGADIGVKPEVIE